MGLLVTWYQQDASSNVIARHPDPNKDHTDAPHPRGDPGRAQPRPAGHAEAPRRCAQRRSGVGDFNPSNPDAWFQSYTQFIVHYAQIAQEERRRSLLSWAPSSRRSAAPPTGTAGSPVINAIRRRLRRPAHLRGQCDVPRRRVHVGLVLGPARRHRTRRLLHPDQPEQPHARCSSSPPGRTNRYGENIRGRRAELRQLAPASR